MTEFINVKEWSFVGYEIYEVGCEIYEVGMEIFL